MPAPFPYFLSALADERDALRRNWYWFLILGVALILLGIFAISYPAAITITTVEVFGFLLLAGGVFEIASGVWTHRWGGFFLHLLCGLLYLFVGAVLLKHPVETAVWYTFFMAVFFIAAGLVRILSSLFHRFSGWGWSLLNGVVTLLLGLMVWGDMPSAALWVIGTFVGIELLFNGWSWVMLGLAAKSLQVPATTRPAGSDGLARA